VKQQQKHKHKNTMKTVVQTNQLSLWHDVIPAQFKGGMANRLSASQNVNDESGDVTSQFVGLLPITAKDGVRSLKSLNPNMSAADLKELHKKDSLELKQWLVQQGTSLMANPDVGGVGVRYTKGRVSLVFKKIAPQVNMLTDEQVAKHLGQSVEWVRKHINRNAPITIDAGTGKELKPSPQNGTPELQPKKGKGRGKKNQPEPTAPATQQ